MSAGPRIPLATAEQFAAEVVRLLAPAEPLRIEIAGSVRRRARDVGDIEIVAQAKDDRIDLLCDDLVHRGVFGEPRLKVTGARVSWGARFKATTFEGVKLDIFIVRPTDCWGVQYLLRTGSGDANKCLVTSRRFGGCMPAGTRMAEGWLWRDNQRLHTPEESDVYRAVGLPWVDPSARTPRTYLDLLASTPAVALIVYTHFGAGGTPRDRFLADLREMDDARRAYFRRRACDFLAGLPDALNALQAKADRLHLRADGDDDHAAEARAELHLLRNRYRTLLEMQDEAQFIAALP